MGNNRNLASFQWNMKQLRLQAQVDRVPSFIPKIALIDSGIDYNHMEFRGKINLEQSWNFCSDNEEYMDELGHGTMMAGIICAENMIHGCCPNVELFVYKITDHQSYEFKNLISAVNKAIDERVNIINLSLSIPFDRLNHHTIELLSKICEKAHRHNIMIVIAAGNGGKELPTNFTNPYSNVALVGATNRKGIISSYSNYGAIDYFAPGGDWSLTEFDLDDPILTCYPSHLTNMDSLNSNLGIPKGYCISYGTSIAAAHITGIIAYLLALYNEAQNVILTPEQIRLVLKTNNINEITV